MAGKKEYELAIKIAGMVDKSLDSSCNLTKKQLRSIAREAANAGAGKMGFTESWAEAGKGIDAAWDGAKKTVLTTAQAMAVAGTAIVGIGAASVNVGKEFESAMSSWAATATATRADYNLARDAAMEMGRKTSKTATESAQALEYMALAGWSVEDSISGLPGILRLSEATGLDLARTSDLVTDSMSALGVEIGALPLYLDVAAKANNKSNQTAELLMEAYIGVGGTMKGLKVPIQESATALGVMANRGIKGSEAGNALNAVMVNLTTGTGQAGKMMKKLGISAFDSKGNFIGLTDTLKILDDSVKNLNDEDRNKALAAIGGKQHIDALNALMSGLNTTVSEGVSEWANLESQLYDSAGALEVMANTKLDNLDGDLAIMRSALEDTGIRIYDNLQEPLRAAAQGATQLVYQFSDNIVDGLEASLPTIRRKVKEGANVLGEFAEPLISVGSWMMDNPDIIAGGLAAIGTTITTLKLAKTITSTATAMNALRVAMMGNPITAAIGVAALAGGAIVGIGAKLKVARKEIAKQGLNEAFGEITLSMSDLEEATDRILGKELIDQLSIASGEIDQFKGMVAGLKDTSDSITKITWKVGMGMELSETDTLNLESDIMDMIESSVELAEQAQYTAHVNMSVLFADGDTEGDEIKNGFNAMYRTLGQKIEEKGKELGEVWKNAMEDGMITPIETETIQKLQKELADLNNMVADMEYEAKFYTIKQKHSGAALDPESFKNLQSELNDQEKMRLEALYTSYGQNMSNLDSQLELSKNGVLNSKEDGYITEYMYEERKQAIQREMDNEVLELKLNNINFQSQSIVDAFSEQMNPVVSEMGTNLSEAIGESIAMAQDGSAAQAWEWDYDTIAEILNFEDMSKEAELAMGDLWKSMEPQFTELVSLKKQYEDAGKEVPRFFIDGINDAAAVGIIAGSDEALWAAVANIASDNPSQREALLALKESGAYMPEELANGITENIPAMEIGVDELHRSTQLYLDTKFDTFSVNSEVDFNFTGKPNYAMADPYGQIGKRAKGGIVTSPEISWIAEAGYPEAVVPLDGSRNAVSIWREAGERLGVFGKDQGGSADAGTRNTSEGSGASEGGRIIFAPVYHIASGDEGTVRSAAEDTYQQFVEFMEMYQRTHERLDLGKR